MIAYFRSKRALIKDLREYQTAFDSLTKSFARHREATKRTADLQQQTIARLNRALDRLHLSQRIAARPLPADLADAIDEETDMKRRLDGLGDQ